MPRIQKRKASGPAPQPKEMEDFKLLKLIGHGGFGKVFLARNLSNRLVAIKVVPKPKTKTAKTTKQIEHLKKEINVFKSFKTRFFPFLSYMYNCFENSSKVYMIMEYYQGGNLYNVQEDYFKMELKRLPSEKEARFYVTEIVCALEFLHTNDMVYRDLKAENIVIERDGHIKLTDFGLCKPNFQKGMSTRTFCGTEGYQAPEMLLKRGYGHGVDVWALGAVLYLMLTDDYIEVNKTDKSAVLPDQIIDDTTGKKITVECHNFIKSLLTADPAHRPDILAVEGLQFLKEVNWKDVVTKILDPPYIPRLINQEDVSRFGEVVEQTAADEPLPAVNYDDLFTEFEYREEDETEKPAVRKQNKEK